MIKTFHAWSNCDYTMSPKFIQFMHSWDVVWYLSSRNKTCLLREELQDDGVQCGDAHFPLQSIQIIVQSLVSNEMQEKKRHGYSSQTLPAIQSSG